jgi:hypothetical protein
MELIENILNTISSDLSKIQVENGYNNSIKEVVYGRTYLDEITNFPSVCYYENTPDTLFAEQESTEYRSITIAIEAHLNCLPENLLSTKRSMFFDLNRLFSNDDSILPIYRTDLNKSNIPELKHISNPYQDATIEHYKNSQTVGILLQIEYITDRKNVGGSYSSYNIPNVLNNYALTSTTDYLQIEIDSLSGMAISGINEWGTIQGTLSNQTDLQCELNNRSLTSHIHLEYFLNSLTSSLTTDLSNYSTTSHSHTTLPNDLTISGNLTVRQPASLSGYTMFTVSAWYGNAIKVDSDGTFYIYRSYPTVNNYYAKHYVDGSGYSINTNNSILTLGADGSYPQNVRGNFNATTRTIKLYTDTNTNLFVLTPTSCSISANISITGGLTTNANITATKDVIAGSTSLTGHTHSFNNLTDISTIPKTWSVMDGEGLPQDGYKEGDFCIMYTNGGEDNVVYHSTYIAINPSIGLTWQQIH